MSDAAVDAGTVRMPPDERFVGKYRGIVVDTDDPQERGRLRAKVPEVLGTLETGWALPCAPYAGDTTGLWAIPPVGAGVWIEFEGGGDPSRPVWVGCWWGDGQAPGDAVDKVVLKTPAGHAVTIDDADGSIRVEESGGGVIVMDGDGITLESNGAKIVLDSQGVTISKGSQKIAVGSSSVSLNDGAMEVS